MKIELLNKSFSKDITIKTSKLHVSLNLVKGKKDLMLKTKSDKSQIFTNLSITFIYYFCIFFA